MSDDNLLPLSALQHLIYCPRQCALIYLEQVWSENLYTAEGRVLHGKSHRGGTESRGDRRTAFGVKLCSRRLGLSGQADVVEFHKVDGALDVAGQKVAVQLPDVEGFWEPYPVEYKRGRPKEHRADVVQLCAQAICLEEMLGVRISFGALYYGMSRRRMEIKFSPQLRELTCETAELLHRFIEAGTTPPAHYEKAKCDYCSLIHLCQPSLFQRKNVAGYIRRMMDASDEEAA